MPSFTVETWEGKLVTAVDELKGPDCGNATGETEMDAKVEKADTEANDLDKLRLSKKKPRTCLNMMKAGSKQPDEDLFIYIEQKQIKKKYISGHKATRRIPRSLQSTRTNNSVFQFSF
jgi:hypothetical protein